jgi:hypothetical protein
MSDVMSAPVTGTGTSEEVTAALMGHLYAAYLDGDLNSVLLYGELILKELANKKDDPVAKATVHLFKGWATMVGAMEAAKVDINLYRAGLREAATEIESILHILLEEESLFAERIAAECYLALIEYHLGNTESGARKLELILSALAARTNVGTKVRNIYIRTMTIIARDFLGVAVPSQEPGAAEPEPFNELGHKAAQVPRERLNLNDETRKQCAALIEQGDAHGMLELTNDLVHVDPNRLTPDAWHMIRRWHAWALVTLGERASGSERQGYFSAVLPLVRELADEAFNTQHTENFVAFAAELSLVLRALGQDDEADMRWQLVCTFVDRAPKAIKAHLHDTYVMRTLDRIRNMGLNLASRALPVA